MFVIWPKNPLKLIKTLVHAVGMVRKSPKALKQAYDLTVDHGIKMAKIKEAKFTFDKPTAWSLDGEESEAQNEAEIKVIKQAVSYLVL
jgi:diacylglycerol kinase family enzyme